ncbi:MAG TPA: biotin/lipoyl-containing protein, partial [Nocardioidaceae bacterium]|nr:biotin/lipoyl-containing protein [Nocardioidaceae bacterium]
MATEVKLPALGESVTEGTVTQWLKAVGDNVAVDEPLLEVSTDKVDTEIPSPVAGTLLEIRAAEDETVEIGAVLAIVGEQGESADDQPGGGAHQAPVAESPQEPQQQESQQSEPQESQQQEPQESQQQESQPQESQPEAPAAAASAVAAGSESGGLESRGGDATEVTLPALGESVTEGTVTQWLKAVGDNVAVDEPLLEVSTDKVDTEI